VEATCDDEGKYFQPLVFCQKSYLDQLTLFIFFQLYLASVQDFFLRQLSSIPPSDDSTNHGNCYHDLCFWALLRCVDRVVDNGLTCLEKCGEETCKLYIHLVYNVGMSVDKMKDMMGHTQSGQVPNWLPTEMCTMSKNYRTKYHNEVLPYYNKTGTWRDDYNLVTLDLWSKYAIKQNFLETKKGHPEKYDVYLPKSSFTNMKLWGAMDYTLCHSRLNISQSIARAGGPKNKNVWGQQAHLSRSQTRALGKVKVDPKTFTVIDLVNKALITKKENRVAMKVYEVGKYDVESGNGIDSAIINTAAKLNNDLKLQKMKRAEWAMIKEALEVDVTDFKEVTAAFMKK
jgi:hypothetical protein